jgi:integration host factor subunit alpha
MKRNNLSKNIILKKINYNLGIPNSFSKKILNLLLEIIIEGLNRDGKVKLSGFGTFKILNKKSRIGRNPKTKVEYKIKARKVVTFLPSHLTKKEINKKN